MNWIWLFLSVRGRLGPERFERAFYGLSAITILGLTILLVFQGNRPRLASELVLLSAYVLVSWPWLALTIKRLHDAERSWLLALPAAVAWPVYGALHVAADGINASASLRIIAWLVLAAFWICQTRIGEFPSAPHSNRFGPEPEPQQVAPVATQRAD